MFLCFHLLGAVHVLLQNSSGLLRLFQHLLKLCGMLKSIVKYKTDLIERSDAHPGCFYEAVLCFFFFPRIQIFCNKLYMPLRGRLFPIIFMKVFLNYFCKKSSPGKRTCI